VVVLVVLVGLQYRYWVRRRQSVLLVAFLSLVVVQELTSAQVTLCRQEKEVRAVAVQKARVRLLELVLHLWHLLFLVMLVEMVSIVLMRVTVRAVAAVRQQLEATL
jgi:hypothetical protein